MTATSATRRTAAEEAAWLAQLEGASPEEILHWAFERFSDRLTVACSFGGITGLALLGLVKDVAPQTDVFTVDTHFLFPETIALRERLRKQWRLNLRVVEPLLSVEEQGRTHGARLWESHPDRCCALRKVEPATRALAGKEAWVVGLRRDQSETRAHVDPIAWDATNGLYRVAPFCHWTEDQVLDWAQERDIPLHPLYFAGYLSIGCTHCTAPVADGQHMRSGRWAGSGKRECGLHLRPVGENI